jgi:hypothetical protein
MLRWGLNRSNPSEALSAKQQNCAAQFPVLEAIV